MDSSNTTPPATTATIPVPTVNSNDPHLQPASIALSWVDLCVCFLCIFGNGSILWLTAINKSIHSNRCCILLAVLALTHVGAKTGSIMPVIVSWTVGYIPQWRCVLFQSIGILSGSTAPCMILAVAVDRFLGAVFPLWYQTRRSSVYFGTIAFLATIPAQYKLLAIHLYSWQPKNAQNMVVCNAQNVCVKETSCVFSYVWGIVATWTSVVLYIAMWLVVRRQRKNSPNSNFVNSTDKIMRSLLVLATVNTFCWTFGFSFVAVTNVLAPNLSPTGVVLTQQVQIIILDSASSLDAPILYFTSSLYRKAYSNFFRSMKMAKQLICSAGAVDQQRTTGGTLFTRNSNPRT